MADCWRFPVLLLTVLSAGFAQSQPQTAARKPVPDKLVVLTFDDSVKSHFTVVRPILLKHGFGATFFITEGFDFKTDKKNYMSWEEIAHLDRDGFEIGNHTRDHMSVSDKTLAKVKEQLDAINDRCEEFGVPRPVSFAYPGNGTHPKAFRILADNGIRFARRGGAPEFDYETGRGFAYEPGFDHPLLLPSAGDARPHWKIEDFKRAVRQAEFGRIAILQFHGVPDLAHPWVNSPIKRFEEYMQYLKDKDYTVIAMRDLARFAGTNVVPQDYNGVIKDRKLALKESRSRDNHRQPKSEDLRAWLVNMVQHHGFTVPEVRSATGAGTKEIEAALGKWNITHTPKTPTDGSLRVLPYPGGRHPRTGFLDGAIRPQRETKLSVFLPWNPKQYVVLDVPEAIRRNDETKHGLLYLAHDHVPTMWTKQNKPLQKLEWSGPEANTWFCERVLPNGVRFGTRVTQRINHELDMRMWLNNRSDETLSQLVVQNCVMLKAAPEFADSKTKRIRKPYVAIRSTTKDPHWMIVAWTPCHRAWQNPPCPCIHSDPRFADCSPGDRSEVRGWFSFYHGDNIDNELDRIAATDWHETD